MPLCLVLVANPGLAAFRATSVAARTLGSTARILGRAGNRLSDLGAATRFARTTQLAGATLRGTGIGAEFGAKAFVSPRDIRGDDLRVRFELLRTEGLPLVHHIPPTRVPDWHPLCEGPEGPVKGAEALYRAALMARETMDKRMMATMGVMSNLPMVGMTRRRGRMMGSVKTLRA